MRGKESKSRHAEAISVFLLDEYKLRREKFNACGPLQKKKSFLKHITIQEKEGETTVVYHTYHHHRLSWKTIFLVIFLVDKLFL